MTTNLILFGATGAVGQEVLKACSRNPTHIPRVHVFVRSEQTLRRLMHGEVSDEWLQERAVITEFKSAEDVGDKLRSAVEIKGDDSGRQWGLISCLGTTQKAAGSSEHFRAIDYQLNLEIAKQCVQLGVQKYFLVSAVGADAKSRFLYSRVKGELEDAVKELAFEEVWIYRPALLLTEPREESRPLETVFQSFSKLVDIGGYWSVRASDVANAILANVIQGPSSAPKGSTASPQRAMIIANGAIQKIAAQNSGKA